MGDERTDSVFFSSRKKGKESQTKMKGFKGGLGRRGETVRGR